MLAGLFCIYAFKLADGHKCHTLQVGISLPNVYKKMPNSF